MMNYGLVLFPGGEITREQQITIKRSEFVAKIREIDAIPRSAEEESAPFTHSNPAVFAFVKYALPAEGRNGQMHYSTIIVDVSAIEPGHPGFDGCPTTMKREEIEFVTAPFSGVNT